MPEENKGFLSVEEVAGNTGEIHSLKPNNNSTIQPIALLRLGVFVPTLKSTNVALRRGSSVTTNTTNATEELSSLKIVEQEGYEGIEIHGPRLDMDTDFKVWVGITSALFDYAPDDDGIITLPFSEFADRCGYPRKRLSKAFRKSIDDSLTRIQQTVVKFRFPAAKGHLNNINVNLLAYSSLNTELDVIEIQPQKQLSELYYVDYKRILKLKMLDKLGRKETAKVLYTFFEALPANPAPVSIERLRARLNLKSSVSVQNSVIRKAMKDLEVIEYLKFSEIKNGRKIGFQIHKRNP
ncbi:RepB family plasmid replication initiator protein [Escherichia coli]|nr:RepB family plasmid replication initiator protein [Escherichia coli]HAX0390021.1 RepB family plasmid replication initiator protein [Escherichia coli]